MALFHLPVEVEDLENWREDRLCVKNVLSVDKMNDDEHSNIVAGSIANSFLIEKCCREQTSKSNTYARILNNQNNFQNKSFSAKGIQILVRLGITLFTPLKMQICGIASLGAPAMKFWNKIPLISYTAS